MNRLMTIVRSGTAETNTLFRQEPYGSHGIEAFLRDVLAMANASLEGARYIVVGAGFDSDGNKRLLGVDDDDFSGKPSYATLANEFIEPPVRIRYEPVQAEGKQVGVFEIGECLDRPYMMRVDYSERLRRGDAYARVKNAAVKLGRRHLQELFERKFRDSVSSSDIEIGFPGDIIHKELAVPTCNLAQLPSAVAGSKLQQMLRVKQNSRQSGSTTVLARLTHARLYGSDDPYVERSLNELMDELKTIRRRYADHDSNFLFERNAQRLQLVVYNQGEEAIRDASLAIVMPNHNAFYVARRLPKFQRRNGFADRSPAEHSLYPAVNLKDASVHVSVKIGDIPAGEPVEVFREPLRMCVGNQLKGHRFGVHYSLFGQNLRTPAKGQLRILFK